MLSHYRRLAQEISVKACPDCRTVSDGADVMFCKRIVFHSPSGNRKYSIADGYGI